VLYRSHSNQSLFGDNGWQKYLCGSLIVINTYFFLANYGLILMNISDLKKKLFLLSQMSNLISPKKDYSSTSRKYYPTLNIFDPISLKTWGNMRKIFMDYGKKFHARNTFNVSIYLLFYSVIVLIFLLQYIGITQVYDDPLLLLIFCYESLVVAWIFYAMLSYGVQINDLFKTHMYLLKSNKNVVSNLQKLEEFYFGPNPVQPDNQIYIEGVKILKKELAGGDFKSKLSKRLRKLIDIFDEEIEELKFEEMSNPFRVLGFTVNHELIKVLSTGLATVVFAVVQRTVDKMKT